MVKGRKNHGVEKKKPSVKNKISEQEKRIEQLRDNVCRSLFLSNIKHHIQNYAETRYRKLAEKKYGCCSDAVNQLIVYMIREIDSIIEDLNIYSSVIFYKTSCDYFTKVYKEDDRKLAIFKQKQMKAQVQLENAIGFSKSRNTNDMILLEQKISLVNGIIKIHFNRHLYD